MEKKSKKRQQNLKQSYPPPTPTPNWLISGNIAAGENVSSMGNKHIYIMDETGHIIADWKVYDDEDLIDWLTEIFEDVLIKSIQLGG